jgi:beta-lactamase regulating signal transducer with metallopeptidase domain
MNLTQLISSFPIDAIGWTLLHSLWQAAAVALLLAPTLWLLRAASPRTRYAACALALALVILLPAVSFCLMPASDVVPDARASAATAGCERFADAAVPSELATNAAAKANGKIIAGLASPQFANIETDSASPPVVVNDMRPPVPRLASAPPAEPWQSRLAREIEPALPWAVTAWLLGVLATSLWHLGGWIAVARLKVLGVQPVGREVELLAARLAKRLGVKKRVQLARSLLVETPLAVGWLRPMILLPWAVLTGLSPYQLEAILAHELAHIRRHDYLVNLLQTLVETLMFHHPAVWWISRRMRLEREQCCDDVAGALCGDRIGYAEALAAVEEVRGAVPAVALAARGTDETEFIRRIRRLLGGEAVAARGASRSLAGALGAVVVLALVVAVPFLVNPAAPSVSASAASGADTSPPKEEPQVKELLVKEPQVKLRYEISLRTPEIKAGSQISIEATLHNDGDEPVAVPWADYAYDDLYCFTITNERGQPLAGPTNRLVPPVSFTSTGIKSVPAHDSIKYNMFLGSLSGSNCQKWYFRAPGKYTLSSSYVSAMDSYIDTKTGQTIKAPGAWKGTLKAAPVQFVVTPDAKTAGPISISGKVEDAKGKVIASAEITIEGQTPQSDMELRSSSLDGLIRREIDRCRTAADGTFAFASLSDESVSYILKVRHDDHAPINTRIDRRPPKNQYEATVVMPDGVTIRGKVLDPEGRPVEGVSVRSYAAEKLSSIHTDAEGRFVVPGIPADNLNLCFWRPGYAYLEYIKAAPQEVASGDWDVRMTPLNKLTLSGIARTADGEPLAGKPIEFRLKDEQGRLDVVQQVNTNEAGRFEVALTKTGKFSGEVFTVNKNRLPVAKARFDPAVERQWRATLQGVQPGDNVQVTFENNRAIAADIQSDGKLPEGMQLAVNLNMACPPDGRWQEVDARLLDSAGTALFDKLTPGSYKVRVFDADNETLGWELPITLADAGQPRVTKIAFPLPKLETGSARIRVVDAAGEPMRDAEGTWYGPTGSRGSFVVQNGIGTIRECPAGFACLYISLKNGEGQISGRIEAGKSVDLGTMALQRRTEEITRIKGRVLYEDGSPALAAQVAHNVVSKDGSFDVQVNAADPLAIDLHSAPGWLNEDLPTSSRDLYLLNRSKYSIDSMFLTVKSQERKSIDRDIIVDRKHNRTIKIVWQGAPPKEPMFSLLVDLSSREANKGSGSSDKQDSATVYLCGSYASQIVKGEMTLTNIPDGEGTLVISAIDYCGYLPLGKGDQTVTFDRSQSGSISGRLVRPDKSAAEGIRVELTPAFVTQPGAAWRILLGYTPYMAGAICISAEDGAFRFQSLGSGQFTIRTRTPIERPGQTVEVSRGQATSVELESEANRDGPPPLRSDSKQQP